MTYKELYNWGCGQLTDAGISESQLDARLLLEYCCGTDRNTLLVHGEKSISAQEYENYADCIARRKEHVPLQQITGEQDFMGLTFDVYENVLIPRQDTEVLVEEVMRHLHDGMRILDMCTGSGCILLSLLHYSNDCTGVGVDISEEALQAARMNARKILGIERNGQECADRIVNREAVPDDESEEPAETGKKVLLIQSDLFEQLDSRDKFDIIVSNPPYIRTDVIETLMPEVKAYEPHLALDGREDGLYFYREIIAQAGAYLNREGMLFFEIGYDQGEEVRRLMENAGYSEVEVVKDFAGLDRVVYGVYSVIA
ncbi:MAG: peptide chain release factor N(5)-glutamine methyltransferase [Lachnospiraceae bacterium]|nr:peptide chain release factor N(5)-glutamine methyltransferase [Lachnospiraceae bacterium]